MLDVILKGKKTFYIAIAFLFNQKKPETFQQ